MKGEEYRNGRGYEMFISSTGILKPHYILNNLIPYQKMDGQTIVRGANIVHGTIGTMICYNNGLDTLGVGIFIYLGLKRCLDVQVGRLSSQDPLKGPYHLDQSTQRFISLFIAHCQPQSPWFHVGNGVGVFLFERRPNRGHLDQITITVDF